MLEPRALNELLPNWKELNVHYHAYMQAPLLQPALKDQMKFLTEKYAFSMPHPPQMNNRGNYIISLSDFVKWLGEQAEQMGVEVYTGIAASKVLPYHC